MSKFVSLASILGQEAEELLKQREGVFGSEKLGDIPYTSVEHPEYKQAKKDCLKMVPDGTGGMVPDLDDDKLMVRLIIAAVDKDKRSDFSFANKQLLEKLGVVNADDAVTKLLSPGEIYRMAVDIQNISGFGATAKKELEKEVKNS